MFEFFYFMLCGVTCCCVGHFFGSNEGRVKGFEEGRSRGLTSDKWIIQVFSERLEELGEDPWRLLEQNTKD